MDMQVLDQHCAQGRILAPCGQLDMQTAPRLSSALDRVLAAGEHRVVVDLSGLTFCDSIGLSALIVAHRSCVEAGGYLRLASPSPFLLNLLTVVGVRDAVGVYETVEAACTADG